MTEQDQSKQCISGGCLCGGVRFQASGPVRDVIYCHCSQCRKTSGHFGAFTNVKREKLEMLAEDTLKWYVSSDQARRGFCSGCGSSLFWDSGDKSVIGIAAGTLNTPTGLKADRHIFVDDKSDYVKIGDDLPQLAKY